MMTRKHYKTIAEIIKTRTQPDICTDPHGQFAKGLSSARTAIYLTLADYFEQDNPRFSRQKFLEACKIDSFTEGP